MMRDNSFRPGSGPSRRRQARNSGKNGAQKNYASENDMPARSNSGYEHPHLPQTPQKSTSASPAPSMSAAQPNSKSRPRNKPRPDSIPLSPECSRPDRPTPLHGSGPKSSTATAFAGATFHASPAPSALPLPKFYSKANESPCSQDKAPTNQQPSSPAAEADPPTPKRILSNPKTHESPLEFMFKADREEKARARRASMANPQCASASPLAPSQSPVAQMTVSSLPSQPRRLLQNYGHQSAESPSNADDYMGRTGQPIGPSFSTPYHERIRAVKSKSSNPLPKPEDHQPTLTPPDRTAALKQFLFASPKPNDGRINPATTTSAATTAQSAPEVGPAPLANGNAHQEERDARLLAMEDGLRRMLKMGS